jgi:hypothetical protein
VCLAHLLHAFGYQFAQALSFAFGQIQFDSVFQIVYLRPILNQTAQYRHDGESICCVME